MSGATIDRHAAAQRGGSGSGRRPQWQVQLATMAAIHLQRSVRVVMKRAQMFTHAHRPECV